MEERLVKDTLRILNIPKRRSKSPLVVFFIGPPASGKTLIARKIEKRLLFCRLTADVIRSFLFPSPTFFNQETKYLYTFLEDVLRELVDRGVNVVYDTSLPKYEDRQRVKKMVEKTGGRVFIIHIVCGEEVAFKRIQKRNEEIQKGRSRGRIIDREYYRFILNTIEPPRLDEKSFKIDTTCAMHGFEKVILRLKRITQEGK